MYGTVYTYISTKIRLNSIPWNLNEYVFFQIFHSIFCRPFSNLFYIRIYVRISFSDFFSKNRNCRYRTVTLLYQIIRTVRKSYIIYQTYRYQVHFFLGTQSTKNAVNKWSCNRSQQVKCIKRLSS